MIDRFIIAKQANRTFNKRKPENNTYLIQNTETGRVYYVQNYKELISVMAFVNPHLKRTVIAYDKNYSIGKWDIVIEDSRDNDHIYLSEKRVMVVRTPSQILGLI